MKQLFRTIFRLLVLAAISVPASAQCYQPLRKEGIDLRRQDNYREAMNRFLAASRCPDRPNSNDLVQQILETQDEWVAELEQERQKARKAQREALEEKREAERLRQAAELSAVRDSLFIGYLESSRQSVSAPAKVALLSQVIAADSQRYSKTLEFCYLERAFTYEEMGLLENAEADYRSLIDLAPPLVQADLFQLLSAFFSRYGQEEQQQVAQRRAQDSYQRTGARQTDRFGALTIDRSADIVSVEQKNFQPPPPSLLEEDKIRKYSLEEDYTDSGWKSLGFENIFYQIGGALANRKMRSRPLFSHQGETAGTVALDVCAGSDGGILYVKPLTTGTTVDDPGIIEKVREYIQQWKFEASTAFQDCGTVVFRFGKEDGQAAESRVTFQPSGRGLSFPGLAAAAYFPAAGMDMAGLNQAAVRTLLSALGPDSYFDRIDTGGEAYLVFGVGGWSLGAGAAPGSLPGFLLHLKALYPEVFEAYFGRFALDVYRGTSLRQGYLTLDGLPVNSAVQKEQFRSAEWAYAFWQAGQDPRVQAAQLKHLLAQMERRGHEIYLLGFTLDQLLTSEFGTGLLWFDLLRQPAVVASGMREALSRLLAETDQLPAGWGTAEETRLLRYYRETRKAGHPDNVMAIAPEAIPFDEPALRQLESRLSSERDSYRSVSQLRPRDREYPVSDKLRAELERLPPEAIRNFHLFLDAGHGGIDPDGLYTTAPAKLADHPKGNFHQGGIFYEGVWNRVMADRIGGKLRKLGIPYLLTHHDYQDVALADRLEAVNQLSERFPGVWVLIQGNASANRQERGFELYTSPGNDEADRLAGFIWEAVKEVMEGRIQLRAQQEARFLALTKANIPVVQIEYLFYDNYEDANLLMEESIQDGFAEATILGVLRYLSEN